MRIRRLRPAPQRGAKHLVAGQIGAGSDFLGAEFLHGGRGHESSLLAHGGEHDFHVDRVGEGAPVDEGGLEGVGAVDEYAATAERFEQCEGERQTAVEAGFEHGRRAGCVLVENELVLERVAGEEKRVGVGGVEGI